MEYPHIDPVLIHIGPVALIRWYALAYIAGMLLGWRYGVWLSKDARLWRGTQPTLDERQIDDLILWLILAIIFGGRIGYVLFYDPAMIWTNPIQVFKLWDGGMSFHGAFTGVAIAILSFAWSMVHREVAGGWAQVKATFARALRIADLVAPCVPFGLFFGRLANYNNGELWGRPTHSNFGLIFPAAQDNLLRYPSQLFEAGLEGVVLFLILRAATHVLKWLPRRGAITGLFVMFYGVFRIALENVREPDRTMPDFPLGLTMGMMLSIPMVAVGLYLLWYSRQPGALAAPFAARSEKADQALSETASDATEVHTEAFGVARHADEPSSST